MQRRATWNAWVWNAPGLTDNIELDQRVSTAGATLRGRTRVRSAHRAGKPEAAKRGSVDDALKSLRIDAQTWQEQRSTSEWS